MNFNDLSEQSVADRRELILERMSDAAKWAARSSSDINLVAVSKQQPDDRVLEGLKSGQRIFGENRVQEAEKRWGKTFSSYRDDLELRLIGPLQTNKAEDAVRLFDVIETLDRMKLAKAIVKASEKVGKTPKLLVQVNIGAEPQKSGVLPNKLSTFLKELKAEYDISPAGLMCIPPAGEAASPHFWWLSNLAKDYGMSMLSMGMSSDFETAIKMDATHVRVGSLFFGERG